MGRIMQDQLTPSWTANRGKVYRRPSENQSGIEIPVPLATAITRTFQSIPDHVTLSRTAGSWAACAWQEAAAHSAIVAVPHGSWKHVGHLKFGHQHPGNSCPCRRILERENLSRGQAIQPCIRGIQPLRRILAMGLAQYVAKPRSDRFGPSPYGASLIAVSRSPAIKADQARVICPIPAGLVPVTTARTASTF